MGWETCARWECYHTQPCLSLIYTLVPAQAPPQKQGERGAKGELQAQEQAFVLLSVAHFRMAFSPRSNQTISRNCQRWALSLLQLVTACFTTPK